MSQAVQCDIGKEIFTYPEQSTTQTGKWFAATVGNVRMVYGTFYVPGLIKESERGGTPMDMCLPHAIEHLQKAVEQAERKEEAERNKYYPIEDDVVNGGDKLLDT